MFDYRKEDRSGVCKYKFRVIVLLPLQFFIDFSYFIFILCWSHKISLLDFKMYPRCSLKFRLVVNEKPEFLLHLFEKEIVPYQ